VDTARDEDAGDDGDSEDSDDYDKEAELMAIVRGAQPNQRIMTWRPRDGDGVEHKWTGTVTKKNDTASSAAGPVLSYLTT
jgi:hypothetical protein